MADNLLTTSRITREAVMLFVNSNAFLGNVNRQYDGDFGKANEKIGSQLRIRLPNDYVTTKGPAASVQDTAEVQTVLTLATQAHVDVSFGTADLLLSVEDFRERFLKPAMNNLAGTVAVDIMTVTEAGIIALPSSIPAYGGTNGLGMSATTGGVCNIAPNYQSDGVTLATPTSGTLLDARAILANNSAPMGDRKLVLDPRTNSRVVNSLTGLLNPTPKISKQYESGQMVSGLGYAAIFEDQTVIKHTTGTFTAGTVNGGGQTGSVLTVNAITGSLNVGDIITFAGVNAVNRVTKQSVGELRTFVITKAAASGATSLSIYPAIVPAVNGNAVQYQTVDNSPLTSATILMIIAPSTVYRKNVAYAPEAITMVTGDLPLPKNVDAARAKYDNVSMRMATQWQVGTDQEVTRLDVLYGSLLIRPEWGCIVPDVI
jgi:hypothetical protein